MKGNKGDSSSRDPIPAVRNEVPVRWRALSMLSVWLLVAYLGIVSPLDRLFPSMDHWYGAGIFLIFSITATYAVLRQIVSRASAAEELTKNITLLAAVLLISMLTIDVAVTAYTNADPNFRLDQEKILATRKLDKNVWEGELMPTMYFPSDANFSLYKPGQVKSASVYGEDYYLALTGHQILRDSVLQTRKGEFVIDRFGLRNTDEASRSRIFVLGDSFAFGYHTSQEAIFPALLKKMLGEPVYNLGVIGTSPMQQYLLTEYMLHKYPDDFKPRKLLWLIFEGNDLEEDYSLKRAMGSRLREIIAGTIVEGIVNIPTLIRHQSIIRLVFGGEIVLDSAVTRQTTANHYKLDGKTLAYPLFHSQRFGYRFFRQEYLDRATQPLSYVLNHPHLPLLADTFRRMKALADERKFEVTIVAVPSAVRLYKDSFEDMPPISKEPYFIRYVEKLSAENGFGYVDLNALMAPYADKELLFYRDDTHWNERGHQIVAQLLAKYAAIGR
jgi:SGNH hydrolase-like domain, acetyltransferase AlgX